MGKLIIFNFDGTCNDPSDAVQSRDRRGAIDDDNITNVLKFHLLAGGNLRCDKPPVVQRQISLYYNGVGTYGNCFQRMFNAGLAGECWDVARILRTALEDFKFYYHEGDKLLLTGFSRGAALARRFAALINDTLLGDDMVEAVFDTVASIGLPNLSPEERPETEVVFEHGHTLPPRVVRALHMVSLDDKRKAFQPTLMNAEEKITEVWFAGAHADVGGGYYFDGLADLVLRFMLDWLEELPERIGEAWRVELRSPAQIDYANLTDRDAGYRVEPDDLQIDPDPFGKNHEQSRSAVMEWLTLTDRRLCTIQDDQLCDQPPLVFHSVAARIARDRNYLPRSLKRKPHQILYENDERKEFTGYAVHRENRFQSMQIPVAGAPLITHVFAHKPYNHSGLHLIKGERYRFSVIGDQQWRDGGITCGPEGWNREGVELGLQELPIRMTEPFRRCPQANWFCLIGAIGDKDEHLFPIGRGTTLEAPETGELCLFANDLMRFYGNNMGKLKVTVERL
ncbi:DUF2235 domain-containing protein [Motiliproteus sp. SC1-56]|uniref:phospholipase effector Tle1 domain-containing protein n=1 Tax=Motiliproteus sp. SC1-56 TaxID=2799565 RepID=UPI001A8FE049|nr:DUF2235 domain-containing protein [Motiliproteus sp. SC1-56]